MGTKTKIDWCDATWNPVTGCLHGCKYCYARRIAERFGGASETHNNECCNECQWITEGTGEIHSLNEPIFDFDRGRNAPFPFDFDPTFYRYKLYEPKKWRKPRNIFVCSMADLFGEWVPMEWIREVFNACREAEQHRYIFLTKNPSRLRGLEADGELPDLPNFWYGSTVETYPDGPAENCWNALFIPSDDYGLVRANTFVSIEPILGDFSSQGITNNVDWVIVGAETGLRAGKITPERRWIENLVTLCEIAETPLFMKDSLRELMGDDFRQEFPWEV